MNELTPTEAHDIVNKEINVILKGCGYIWFNSLSEEVQKILEEDICMKNQYCLSCKGKLKGIISQEKTEIEFLEKLSLRRIKREDKRLQALKISMADLQDKTK